MEKLLTPKEVTSAIQILESKGFEAFIVGGCVRDLLLGRKPRDWDITTNAKPDEIQEAFPSHFYNNKYGTVTIVNEETDDESLRHIEITPYRIDAAYTDKRHPDSVKFGTSLKEDLERRDFTINAMAYNPIKKDIIDPYNGQKDIKDKLIKAVGDPNKRLEEDALRLLRAVRIATELGFTLNNDLLLAVKKRATEINEISAERVRDELVKIVNSEEPRHGFELLEEVGLLEHIIPELREGLGIEQNQAHAFHVFEHNLRAIQHAAKRKFSFHVRLAALLHDVAKPATRVWGDKKSDWTFYGHDVVGGKMTRKILTRLKFSRETVEKVSKLVRYHLFFSDPDKITMSAVRRLVRNVGRDDIWELMDLRVCDRIGTGRPKEHPYRLRKYESMVEEALRQPVTVGMLAIKGDLIMEKTGIAPGPKIGFILHALLEEVLDDPSKNDVEVLANRAIELSKLDVNELKAIGERGKERREKTELEAVQQIRKKHWVE